MVAADPDDTLRIEKRPSGAEILSGEQATPVGRLHEDYRYRVICDPVHGEIPLSRLENELIDTPSFQRLRNLKQLGLAPLVYPNATHTRFAHSLGVFRIMSRVIDLLEARRLLRPPDKRIMRIAALVHDIGHYPYSHLMEFLDRDEKFRPFLLSKSSAPGTAGKQTIRYPKHEKIGELIISKRQDVRKILDENSIDADEIAAIIRGKHANPAYNRLMHSSLDMDRMDYLVRDSLGTGVPYGRIDIDYLLSNLDIVKETDAGGNEIVDVVLSRKGATAAEHFLIARYFMHKVVYFHKTTFGLEALLRHILFMMRDRGAIYPDGAAIESMILTDEFLDFHDGYVDRMVQKFAAEPGNDPLFEMCRALRRRIPPKLVGEVGVLKEGTGGRNAEYELFRKDKLKKVDELAQTSGVPKEFWIWEDLPKDVSFESLGPFVPLSGVDDLKPEETAELIRIRASDGGVQQLVDDQNSIIHHLSKLRFQASRLYLALPVTPETLGKLRAEVCKWSKPD